MLVVGLVFLLWIRTSYWVSRDSAVLKLSSPLWNLGMLLSGLAGFLSVPFVPRYYNLLPLLAFYGLPLYAYVRHPMYSAFWLLALAQVFLLPNWFAGLAGPLGWGTLFFLRVGREEELMIDTFGEEYRRYMARTKRVVPGLY